MSESDEQDDINLNRAATKEDDWDEFDDEGAPDAAENDEFQGLPYEAEAGTPDPTLAFFENDPARSQRCAHCGTTWERIRNDGRVGCANCYLEFREQLTAVMVKMQRGEAHTGKTPLAANKRRLRLDHLRKRRDNQLALLKNRLQEAVTAERYEEAAQLRDKIKVVSSSIFSEPQYE